MKKTVTTSIFLLLVILTAQAQVDRSSFKAGLLAGIPVGESTSRASSFAIGLDANYHWGVSKLLDVGLASGFINAFGDTETSSTIGGGEITTSFEDFQFIPAAASVRIYPTYEFKFGADVGYAFGASEETNGGFYYRPVVGYNITGNTEINVSYMAITDDTNFTFSMVMAGVLFLF
ncbi:outer membrane beta-barrel protein [Flagellimonas sp.]|uniref:outer membrane beta-barrel protein n=1 Tax=Flagellimonas sp. TaxID=2058762 RepID=UPI003F4A4D2D